MNFDVVKQLVAYGREQEKLHDKHFRFYADNERGVVKRRYHGILQIRKWTMSF